MKKIKNQKKIVKTNIVFLLISGVVLSATNASYLFDSSGFTHVTGFHAKTMSDLHDHGKHPDSLREHLAGHYIDPRHLRHVGSGGHKLTVNDLKHNSWNYYLATAFA